MRSKRSCFDKTAFKKNLTRFAPVWILYTLCLVGMLAIQYSECTPEGRVYYFAWHLTREVPNILAVLNIVYALLAAELLFGDLFNSRMCNALHALPLRRETWFVTNLASGLFFSLVPTVVMALAALPMLAGSIFVGAWKIPFQLLLLANLEYLCFFGMAAFAAMCVGNRFTMAAGYGLLNAGALIVYWMVDIVYTPMLYGVLTPTHLASLLTPVESMTGTLYEMTDYSELYDIVSSQKVPLESLTATYSMTDVWGRIAVYAAVGVVLMALAVLLYRKRNLECAGDAVAFRGLVPVFQVLCSLFVMASLLFFLGTFFGLVTGNISSYVILAVGMILGWVIGKMLVARSTRIFQLKNFWGLGVLGAAVALSLVCTHFDILGIETKLPDASKVESIFFETNYIPGMEVTGEQTIADIIHIQELALQNRPRENKDWRSGDGLYVKGYDGSFVYVVDSNDGLYDTSVENPEFTYAAQIGITYLMKDGSLMKRRYNIWTESEEGELAKKYISSWEFVNEDNELWRAQHPEYKPELERAMESFESVALDGYIVNSSHEKIRDIEKAYSLIEAVKADCAAGTMAQDYRFHKDVFQDPEPWEDEDGELRYDRSAYVRVEIRGTEGMWDVQIYPDSENCVRWLREQGLMDYDILPNSTRYWYPDK